jgi:hypothetical protein
MFHYKLAAPCRLSFSKYRLAFTMTDSSHKNRLLRAWENDWYCYWDSGKDGTPSYGVPQDPDKDYVFKPALHEETPTSPLVVVSVNARSINSESVQSARTLLVGLHAKLTEGNIACDCLGSEGQNDFSPFLLLGNLQSTSGSLNVTGNTEQKRQATNDDINDGEEEEPSSSKKVLGSFLSSKAAAKFVLEALGAHPVLIKNITIPKKSATGAVPKKSDHEEEDEDEDAGVFGKLSAELFEKLTVDGITPFVFYCGSGKLNPVPLFVISRLAPNVLGGFLSAIVHT